MQEAEWRELERSARFCKWKRDVSENRAEELKILGIAKKEKKSLKLNLQKLLEICTFPSILMSVSWCLTLVAPLFLWS